MKCPYCAETISNAAIVCKHCGRDFQWILPLKTAIAELSKRLEVVEAAHQVSRPHALAHASQRNPVTTLLLEAALYALVLASAVPIFHFWGAPDWLILSYLVGSPILVGLACGYRWGDRNLPSLWILALLFTAAVAGITVNQVTSDGSTSWDLEYKFHWIAEWSSFRLVAGLPTLFCSFVAIGDAIFRKANPSLHRAGLASRVAQGLVRRGSGSEEERMARIERLKAALIAFAPLFTLIGTITGAILSYMGAVQKVK